MTRSIWMCPWDLEERAPDAVLDELQGIGLTACSLALSYHGGRMVLPRHPSRFVYEQNPGAVYFESDPSRYGRLKPVVSPLAALAPPFLAAAQKRSFPVWAWTVLCHNDFLGKLARECCIENAFGDRYTYALCPSNPAVQDYVLALCSELAALPGIAGLDIEALSFMGYEHASLHDKCGIQLGREAVSLLSLCFCEYCRAAISPVAEELRPRVREAIRANRPLDWTPVLTARGRVLLKLLSRLRTLQSKINLRIALDPQFHGGKTALALDEIEPLVDLATLTFFGSPLDAMQVPPHRVPLQGGMVFHAPDSRTQKEFRQRLERLESADLDGIRFYCYSMAGQTELSWLRSALKG